MNDLLCCEGLTPTTWIGNNTLHAAPLHVSSAAKPDHFALRRKLPALVFKHFLARKL
jgi:hypothetical protein